MRFRTGLSLAGDGPVITKTRSRPGAATAVALVLLAAPSSLQGFAVGSTISPEITAAPVNVVLWIRDNVSPEDEARTVASIEAGLDLWKSVATSHIAFNTTVVRSATQPPTDPEDLLVIVAYGADLTRGGASLPRSGLLRRRVCPHS